MRVEIVFYSIILCYCVVCSTFILLHILFLTIRCVVFCLSQIFRIAPQAHFVRCIPAAWAAAPWNSKPNDSWHKIRQFQIKNRLSFREYYISASKIHHKMPHSMHIIIYRLFSFRFLHSNRFHRNQQNISRRRRNTQNRNVTKRIKDKKHSNERCRRVETNKQISIYFYIVCVCVCEIVAQREMHEKHMSIIRILHYCPYSMIMLPK